MPAFLFKRFHHLACLLLTGMLVLLFTSATKAQRYPFFHLSIEDGLVQSQATSLAQDSFGNLWIGTLGGLSRYDGQRFTNYSVRDGLAGNAIYSLATHPDGSLWMCTAHGVSRFDGRKFRHFRFASEKGPEIAGVLNSVKVAPDGTVWALMEGRLYRMVYGEKTVPALLPQQATATAMLPDHTGAIWVAEARGPVHRFYKGKDETFTLPQLATGAVPVVVLCLKEDAHGTVWMATNGGLFYVKNNRVLPYTVRGKPLTDLPTITSLTTAPDESLWLGTSSGILHVTDSSMVRYRKEDGLSDNLFYDVFTDAEGNIWMASDAQGIFRFSGAPFVSLDENSGLPSAQVMSIAATPDGTLYLGTYDAGLFTFKNGAFTRVKLGQSEVQAVTAMVVDDDNAVWVGTRTEGIYELLSGGAIRHYARPEFPLPSNSVAALHKDAQGQIWAGYKNNAVFFGHDSIHMVSLTGTVEDFINLPDGSLLIATETGIRQYSNHQIRPFFTNTIADSVTPQCFALRGADELWIGTNDMGLICYHLKTKKSFVLNRSNGLHSDFIYNLIADDEGALWAGTGFGIHRIRPSAMGFLIDFFGKGQGVTGLESNHNAVYKMPDGSIWFGTTQGAMQYRPQAKAVHPRPVSLVLQSVKLFGEAITDSSYFKSLDSWYGVPQGLQLPYKKNNLTFQFGAVSLSGAEGIHYRYRIDGLDAPWSDWTPTTSVTFSALPSGNYTLRVQAATDRQTVLEELSYPFTITTPFHKTGVFRLLILSGCILLGIFLQYSANHRRREREEMMNRLRREEQDKVRQRTAEDFHDEVGNKLTRINVLTNVLKSKAGTLSPDAARIIEQIQDNTGQLYTGTRDILWSLKPSNDNLYEILLRIRDFGVELFQDTEIDFVFTGTDDKWKSFRLPLDYSRNLTMIFKEALNNALKYSGATTISIDAHLDSNNLLTIRLCDNGRGFDLEQVKRGHGIDNINVRTKRLNGTLVMDTATGKSTSLALSFVVPGK